MSSVSPLAQASAEPPGRMRAAFIRESGGTDRIQVGSLPVPRPGPTDVLVRMAASEVNHVDLFVRSGAYPTHTPFPFALDTVPEFAISESPTYVARGVAALAGDRDHRRFAGQVLTARQLADTYDHSDTNGSRPDCWGYIAAYGIDEQSGKDVDQYR